ncbi:MAG: N-glycosylase/DNA lyase [Candidatus Omnitrophica bacterium]|nr:N-glycosylase/DNA lyase [Candidatus Omnitrophota bacterium]
MGNNFTRLKFVVKKEIKERLKEFAENRKREDKIFEELCFCILTPQSKAKNCWHSIESLKKKGLLLSGKEEEIKKELKNVRFKNKKAKYLIEARNFFLKNGRLAIKSLIDSFNSPFELREYLVKNIKGLGYKEASHFLRNIGFGDNIAILDRHILRNLKRLSVIREIPKSLSKKKYLEIEKRFIEFSKKINIKPSELDLILWAKETGFIFK